MLKSSESFYVNISCKCVLNNCKLDLLYLAVKIRMYVCVEELKFIEKKIIKLKIRNKNTHAFLQSPFYNSHMYCVCTHKIKIICFFFFFSFSVFLQDLENNINTRVSNNCMIKFYFIQYFQFQIYLDFEFIFFQFSRFYFIF